MAESERELFDKVDRVLTAIRSKSPVCNGQCEADGDPCIWALATRTQSSLRAALNAAPAERIFEAKLLGFAEHVRARLCEPCLKRAVDDNLVIFSSAVPAAKSAKAARDVIRRAREWITNPEVGIPAEIVDDLVGELEARLSTER